MRWSDPAALMCWIKEAQRGLTMRLLLTFMAGFVLLVIMIHLYFVWRAPNILIHAVLDEQMDYLLDSTQRTRAGLPEIIPDNDNAAWILQALRDDLGMAITDSRGHVVAEMDPRGRGLFPEDMTRLPLNQLATMDSASGVFSYVFSQSMPSGFSGFRAHVAISSRLVDIFWLTDIEPLLCVVLLVSILSLILVSVVVLYTIRVMLAPLKRLSRQARDIHPGNLQQRLPTARLPREVEPLVSAFNGTLARLEAGFQVQQELLATTAHELKTPLALLRGEVEMQLPDSAARQQLLDDVDHIVRQVHQILHFAEVREQQNYQFAAVDTIEQTGEVIQRLQRHPAWRQRVINFDFSAVKNADIRADAGAFYILVKNLLENALVHGPADQPVEIILTEQTLRVRDYGPGISGDMKDKVFERFWRADQQSQGAGLGLAICREVALAHGWQLIIEQDWPGTGFCLSFVETPATSETTD
ncbi:ATP-binding protein [Pokkaliibacter sp. CJK22405]|uniref:sensor histidine kinase n=1 Tax=Pokkaliibacter sp. CJK22405 TaxID=3384615 RepID=UPI003984EA53